jgi:hypothetical protein
MCEPVEACRRLARKLEATLRLAARLQRGELAPWLGPGAQGWEIIVAADPMNAGYRAWIGELSAGRAVVATSEAQTPAGLLDIQRDAIAHVVHLWLTLGGVQLAPYRDAARSTHSDSSQLPPCAGSC